MKKRTDDAKALKRAGERAYSDAHNHVIVKFGGSEHGYDLSCAIQLRDSIDRAISMAALPDDIYK